MQHDLPGHHATTLVVLPLRSVLAIRQMQDILRVDAAVNRRWSWRRGDPNWAAATMQTLEYVLAGLDFRCNEPSFGVVHYRRCCTQGAST
jgi:hypothetical protein